MLLNIYGNSKPRERDVHQISAEFLDALQPEIWAEILYQERIEKARRRAEEKATVASAGAGV
jgi:hypothetical protein